MLHDHKPCVSCWQRTTIYSAFRALRPCSRPMASELFSISSSSSAKRASSSSSSSVFRLDEYGVLFSTIRDAKDAALLLKGTRYQWSIDVTWQVIWPWHGCRLRAGRFRQTPNDVQSSRIMINNANLSSITSNLPCILYALFARPFFHFPVQMKLINKNVDKHGAVCR